MHLKSVMNLSKVCAAALMLSNCSIANSNDQVDLYRADTVSVLESEDALLEVGLRNIATGKKHGLWYYYDRSNLVRIESFREGVETGPMVGFATGNDGKTGVLSLSYIVNGEFNGPSVYLHADSTINMYDYYVKGHSVNSFYSNGEGVAEVEFGDSTFKIEPFPVKR